MKTKQNKAPSLWPSLLRAQLYSATLMACLTIFCSCFPPGSWVRLALVALAGGGIVVIVVVLAEEYELKLEAWRTLRQSPDFQLLNRGGR